MGCCFLFNLFGVFWEWKVLALLYMLGKIPQWKCPVLDFSLLGILFNYKINFTTKEKSVCQIVYFFLVQSCQFVLFQDFVHFLLGCPICWYIIKLFIIFFYDFWYICDISWYFFFFISVYLAPLFYPWWVWLMIYHFLYFSKN